MIDASSDYRIRGVGYLEMAHKATPDERKIKSKFDALTKEAFFDVLLPRSADFDAAKAIRNGSPEELHRAPTRRNLFFGNVVSLV